MASLYDQIKRKSHALSAQATLSIAAGVRRFPHHLSSLLKYCCRVCENHLHPLKILRTWLALTLTTLLLSIFLPWSLLLYKGLKWWRQRQQTRAMQRLRGGRSVAPRMPSESWGDEPPILTVTIFALDAPIERDKATEQLNEIISKENYINWRSRLIDLEGHFYWDEAVDFKINKHVIDVPSIFRQTAVTKRNIQEYVSILCDQTPMARELPPWQILLISGTGPQSESIGWLVLRAHPLLTAREIFPNVGVKTFIDPWRRVKESSETDHPLFSAPNATLKLLRTMNIYFRQIFKRSCIIFFTNITSVISEIISSIYIISTENTDSEVGESNTILRYTNLIRKYSSHTVSFISKCFSLKFVVINVLIILPLKTFVILCTKLFRYFRYTIEFCFNLSKYSIVTINRLRDNPTSVEKILIDALIELYWVTRAFISIPRLIIETVYEAKCSASFNVWSGIRRSKCKSIAWGGDFSTRSISGESLITNSQLNSVLLTAAITTATNLLKSSKIPMPPRARCTVPISTSLDIESNLPSSFPMSFNTECSNVKLCQKDIQNYMKNLKRYPEKYIVSNWIYTNLYLLLPKNLFGTLTEIFTRHYPIMITCIDGPSEEITLFDEVVREIYHLRQPHHNSVLSVSVTSYNGSLMLGGIGAEWIAPYTVNLARSLETSLQDILGDVAVRKSNNVSPVRKSRNFSRQLFSRPSCNSVQASPAASPTIHNDPETIFFHRTLVNELSKVSCCEHGSSFDDDHECPNDSFCVLEKTFDNIPQIIEKRSLNNSLYDQIMFVNNMNDSRISDDHYTVVDESSTNLRQNEKPMEYKNKQKRVMELVYSKSKLCLKTIPRMF